MPEVEVRRPGGERDDRVREDAQPAQAGRGAAPAAAAGRSARARSAARRGRPAAGARACGRGRAPRRCAPAARRASPPSARGRRRSTTAATAATGAPRSRSVFARRKYMTPTTRAGASCSGATSKVTWASSEHLRRVRCRTCPIVRLRRSVPIMSAASCARPSCCARADFDETLSADELRAIEDEAIRGAVRMQEDVGLKSATDGEFRRASWHMDFIYQLGGISKSPGQPGGQVPQRRRRHRVHAGGDAHRRQGHAGEADLRAATSSSCRASSPAPRPSSRSRRRAWSTTAAAARRSSSPSTRTWTSSGTT